MASKSLIFLFIALLAFAWAVEDDRDKRGLTHGYYGKAVYPGYGGYYGKAIYPGYGGHYGGYGSYYGLGYGGYGSGHYGLGYGLGHYGIGYGHHGVYY